MARRSTPRPNPTPEQLLRQLENIRGSLDAVDSAILRHLHRRIGLVREIGKIKEGLSSRSWAPAREKEVLERLVRENRGRFPERGLRQIFREIFSISREQERPLQIGYYGLPGSLTHAAASEQFGSSTKYEPADSLEQVFDRVASGALDYGFVPVEISVEGIVSSSLEVFLRSDLRICAESYFALDLSLAASTPRKRLRRVFMQPQVYGLVREWIALELPKGIEVVMTAESREAGQACKDEPGSACITQAFTARWFGLKILQERIPYGPARRLRFLTAGTEVPRATRSDKTTIAFSLTDKVGVLEQALKPFRRHRINLTFLESYPQSKASPTVTFFADILGHMDRPAIADAVEELRGSCAFVRVLGSYPVFRT
jgi:chorismate mutase/prephenate dehydratase